MLRNLLILVLVALVFWLAVDVLVNQQRESREVAVTDLPVVGGEPSVVPPTVDGSPNLVGDISVHTADELEILFDRVERLLERPRSDGEAPLISLVLHGPEVEFFALENYSRYKNLVDRAAKLAALGGIDIGICQTRMRSLGIEVDQVPSFLRQIPFGPAEVERLVTEGYVYM